MPKYLRRCLSPDGGSGTARNARWAVARKQVDGPAHRWHPERPAFGVEAPERLGVEGPGAVSERERGRGVGAVDAYDGAQGIPGVRGAASQALAVVGPATGLLFDGGQGFYYEFRTLARRAENAR